MKKINLKPVLWMLGGLIIIISSVQQTNAGDLQRRREAVRLFVNKQYARALPLFAQLVSNHPENFKFNYYYGVCLMIADKDKVKAVEHLERSLKNPKSPEEVYYYLAKAYHYCYMNNEGVRAIAEFHKLAKEKQRIKYKTEEVSTCIHNAKQILDSSRNSMVKEFIPATPEDFFTKYAFEGNYGKILSMPEEYRTKKNSDENPTIFLSADGSVMFFSSYSAETYSRDIFRSYKMPDGIWSKPERLEMEVNSPKDELFPTCSPDGHVLYFSSMGHKSTGGFDIYKSVFSRAENKWSKAENMGSPYNSPFDDYNFVPSSADGFAYFTSSRDCNWGQLMVCKVDYNSAEQLPIELQGKFSCINEPEMKVAMITVTRLDNDMQISMQTTDEKTGAYNVMLPGAGTYRFKVEAVGYEPHTQDATFSEFSDKFFIQKIYLSRNQAGVEDLAINQLRENERAILDANLMATEAEDGSNVVSAVDITPAPQPETSPETKMADASPAEPMPAKEEVKGIEYRVQVGAFKKQSVAESKRLLAKKTKDNLINDNYDNQWNRFYVGSEDSYAKANNLKAILQMAGFKGAFIVAYKDNKPVPLKSLEIDSNK